ncbi:hypothetical protein CMO88_04270 [Candidatus Woesearchaeota archaeon]|nr:hypothetical protein [Candidatus Woesearchaeota archaeon]|tara:strand:+ start:3073 stop:3834 length:762 start_codon:yes stop_codon:yes gene_type:complete
MGPEKEIVELWLNRKGFFTIKDINAGSRVIDMVAIKQDKTSKIAHVEVACYVSGSIATKASDLMRKFNSAAVVKKIRQTIKEHIGAETEYEKFLITTVPNINLDGVNVIGFDKVLFEFVNNLDKQYYSNNVTRTLQLVKFILMSNPSYIAKLIGKEHDYKAFTSSAREQFIRDLFEQDVAKKIFSKKSNEELMIELLKNSTLKNPESLASALDKILTKRTATKFLNTLLKQKGIKTSIKPKIKNKTLQQFVEV